MKQKTFFLVSQVLSFRHTKQTSKNVVDTTFKVRILDIQKLLRTVEGYLISQNTSGHMKRKKSTSNSTK